MWEKTPLFYPRNPLSSWLPLEAKAALVEVLDWSNRNIDNFDSFTHFFLYLAPHELRVDDGLSLEEIIKYIPQIQLKVKEINLGEEDAQAMSKLRPQNRNGS